MKDLILRLKNEQNNNNRILVFLILIVVLLLTIATNGAFFSPSEAQLIAYLFPEMGILSLGYMLCMIRGGDDLACTSIAAFSGILGCQFLKKAMPVDASLSIQVLVLVTTFLFQMLIGSICGAFTGILVAVVGIPPLLASLGTGYMIFGLAIGLTNGSAISDLPAIFNQVISGKLFEIIPITTVVYAICALSVSFILNRTSFGYKIYMIGSNSKVALYSGINVSKVTIQTYALSGMFASISGLLMCGHFSSARANYGKSYLLPVMLCLVLGGVNPNGGEGKVNGVTLAVILLQTLACGFAMFQQISDYYKNLVWGSILILSMIIKKCILEKQQRKDSSHHHHETMSKQDV